MLIRIIRWLRGYLFLKIEKGAAVRFINLCNHHNIYMWNIKNENEGYTFNIFVKDYFRLNDIAYKSNTYPRIIYKRGLCFVINTMIKQKTFLPFFSGFIISIYILSSVVWNIYISGNMRHSCEELSEYISECNINRGTPLRKLNLDMLEKNIRNRFPDIGWVSASLEGTNIYVKVLENDSMEKATPDEAYFSHIIASSDGIIDSIVTRSGTPLVKPGDIVKKGDILISGIVEFTNDSMEVYKKSPVYADGDVYIISDEKYRNSFDMNYLDKVFTGRTKTEYSIMFGGRLLRLRNILNDLEKYKYYDIINTNVSNGFVYKKDILEYTEIKRHFTAKEAVNKAKNIFKIYILKCADNQIEIIGHNVKAKVGKEKCIAEGKITYRALQKERKGITKGEWSVTQSNDGKDS